MVSLNDNPAFPDDNIWLATPVITFRPVKRDRFNVVLDIRPEVEVPLNIRPDLMVVVTNKEHTEKQLYFRVTSTWVAPVLPTTVIGLDDFNVFVADNTPSAWQAAIDNTPAGWALPTVADMSRMAGTTLSSTPTTITNADFLKAFPDEETKSRAAGGTSYWLTDEVDTDNARALVMTGDQAAIVSLAKTENVKVRYMNPLYDGFSSVILDLGAGKTPVFVAPKNVYDNVQFKNANFAPDGNGMCPAGWNVPTKDEAMAIFGLQGEEWPEDVSMDILKAWPAGTY